jgi:hypothetical protein
MAAAGLLTCPDECVLHICSYLPVLEVLAVRSSHGSLNPVVDKLSLGAFDVYPDLYRRLVRFAEPKQIAWFIRNLRYTEGHARAKVHEMFSDRIFQRAVAARGMTDVMKIAERKAKNANWTLLIRLFHSILLLALRYSSSIPFVKWLVSRPYCVVRSCHMILALQSGSLGFCHVLQNARVAMKKSGSLYSNLSHRTLFSVYAKRSPDLLNFMLTNFRSSNGYPSTNHCRLHHLFAFLFAGMDSTTRKMIEIMRSRGDLTIRSPDLYTLTSVYRSDVLRARIGVHNIVQSMVVFFKNLASIEPSVVLGLIRLQADHRLLVDTLFAENLLSPAAEQHWIARWNQKPQEMVDEGREEEDELGPQADVVDGTVTDDDNDEDDDEDVEMS